MKLYAKSLLYILLAVASVLVTAMADNFVTIPELVNIAIIGLGAVAVYLVPNLPAGIAQYSKTSVAFLAAAAVAVQSFLTDGITTSEWLQIAIAAFAGIGVYIVPNEKPVEIVTAELGEVDTGGLASTIAAEVAHRIITPGAHNE